MRRPPILELAPIVALALGLAACGGKGDLRPKPGTTLPIAYGRDTPPSTAALMKPPPQAAPERSTELRVRSEPRQDDPFNLPPKE